MAGVIEVIDPGAATTVQDGGRYAYRHLGVPVAGALDPLWLACANALAGNAAPATAGLECRVSGPRLRVAEGVLRVALAAAAGGVIERAGGDRETLAPWCSTTLAEGDTLGLAAVGGVAYLAFHGGLDLTPQLGSRSTYAAAGLGGIAGRRLQAGDRLICAGIPAGAEKRQAAPRCHDEGPLRLIAGPQADHFTAASHAALTGTAFTVSRDADRMGMRLDGARLDHVPGHGADIVSDGTTPGAIQVPADGRPIVLLADCQTVGGYAKIATVIRADLPRLAHLLPGAALRFALVGDDAASLALHAQARRLTQWLTGIASRCPVGATDAALLLANNLVSGMVDALADGDGATADGPEGFP